MKKVYLSALALCLFAGAVQAQSTMDKKFKWGFKLGLNASNLRMKNTGTNPSVTMMAVDGSEWKTGLATGLFFNVRLANKLSLQPELLYSSMGGLNLFMEDDSRLRLNYFSIPLMAKYKLCNSIAITAGPQIDMLINAKTKSGDDVSKATDSYRDHSFNLTGGVEFWPAKCLGITGRYIHGLTNISNSSFYEVKNQGVQATLAVKF